MQGCGEKGVPHLLSRIVLFLSVHIWKQIITFSLMQRFQQLTERRDTLLLQHWNEA